MARPTKTQKYPNLLPFFFELNPNHKIERSTVTKRGYPAVWLPGLAGKDVTIIIGKKEQIPYVDVIPADQVFTCVVGEKGNISSVGKENAGKEITIIYENPN